MAWWRNGIRPRPDAGGILHRTRPERDIMSAATATLTRTLTGGPKDDDDNGLVENIAGWVLVVVVAMLVTRLGLV